MSKVKSEREKLHKKKPTYYIICTHTYIHVYNLILLCVWISLLRSLARSIIEQERSKARNFNLNCNIVTKSEMVPSIFLLRTSRVSTEIFRQIIKKGKYK